MAPIITLAAGELASSELEIKRSRFLGFALRCESEEAARDFFASIRTKYPDARHHCTALLVCEGGQEVARSSDDGEPSGTAGMPMLQTLRGSGLINVGVVVVRYFGGIKLGTGGLVRAYSDTTSATLNQGSKVRVSTQPVWQVAVSHAEAGKFHAAAEHAGLVVLAVDYAQHATFQVAATSVADGQAQLAHLTGGSDAVRRIADRNVERPYR